MNTEKTSHKKRMKDAAGRLFALAVSAVIALSAPVPYMRAFAADTPVVESRDPEDAVKGHVYIRAALQEGYSPVIHVELLPETEGCVSHSYVLDAENGYGVSDDIAEGVYGCICYTDESSNRRYDVQAVYGGEAQEVREGTDDPPCFLVIAGSPEFAENCRWLSTYRDSEGEYLKGTVTAEQIMAITGRLTALQDNEEDAAVPDNPPEEYHDPSIPAGEGSTAEEPAADGPETEKEEEKSMPHWAFFAAGAAVALILAGVALAGRKIRQRKGGNAG